MVPGWNSLGMRWECLSIGKISPSPFLPALLRHRAGFVLDTHLPMGSPCDIRRSLECDEEEVVTGGVAPTLGSSLLGRGQDGVH